MPAPTRSMPLSDIEKVRKFEEYKKALIKIRNSAADSIVDFDAESEKILYLINYVLGIED